MEHHKTLLVHPAAPSLGSELAARLFARSTLLVVYIFTALFAAISKLLQPAGVEAGGHVYAKLQNYAIFRNGFFHLIHHQDLYARYVNEYGSYYRYSPAFALLMAPFAALPYTLGAVLFTLINALALFSAIWAIPGVSDRARGSALWFLIIPLTVSMQNAQINAVMAALMIGALLLEERGRPVAAALSVTFSVFIKLFGGLASLPCLLVGGLRRRARFVAGGAFWTAIFAVIPLVIVAPSELLFLYKSWRLNLQQDQASWQWGLDVKGMALAWFHVTIPDGILIPIALAILCGVMLLRRDAWADRAFRLFSLSSVLIWVVIFNFRAESPTMIIAVTGVVLWYFVAPELRGGSSSGRSLRPSFGAGEIVDLILLLSVFLFTCLATTDAIPHSVRKQLPFHAEVAPVVAVWIKIQFDLLRFRTSSAAARA